VKIERDGDTIVVRIETTDEREALIAGLDYDRNHPARLELYLGLRAMRPRADDGTGPHPLSNCGPLAMDIPEGRQCPTCGVPAGSVPTAEALADIRRLWPHYPRGYWR
jgi:hypothetical protein